MALRACRAKIKGNVWGGGELSKHEEKEINCDKRERSYKWLSGVILVY